MRRGGGVKYITAIAILATTYRLIVTHSLSLSLSVCVCMRVRVGVCVRTRVSMTMTK